jgi:hypothetical protein
MEPAAPNMHGIQDSDPRTNATTMQSSKFESAFEPFITQAPSGIQIADVANSEDSTYTH